MFLFYANLVAASLTLAPASPEAKEFTFDAKVNQQVARKLKIPVYFAVPASARAAIRQGTGR